MGNEADKNSFLAVLEEAAAAVKRKWAEARTRGAVLSPEEQRQFDEAKQGHTNYHVDYAQAGEQRVYNGKTTADGKSWQDDQ